MLPVGPILAIVASLMLAGCMPTRWEKPPEETQREVAKAPRAKAPKAAARRPAPGSATSRSGTARSELGNPPFYEVFGKRYYVLPDGQGFREQGTASWYGSKFHGRPTSSGEIYDMHQLTAAHRTLPLPTLVRVTNLANGRSVVVTVNDRGPFAKNRVIDLSYAAAQELDMVHAGLAEVSVEAVGDNGGALPDVYMQVGAFGDRSNAAALKERLESIGIDDVVIRFDDSTGNGMYRVRIGPLEREADFDALALRLAPLNIGGPQLVSESSALAGPP